jgi:hypothetical protein
MGKTYRAESQKGTTINTMKYQRIIIDTTKDPKDYTFLERRAEIWIRIQERGDPSGVNQSALAKHYGVAQSMIWKDIKAIKADVITHLGKEIKFRSDTIYSKVIKTLSDSKDPKDIPALIKAVESYNGWLFNVGAQEKSAETVRIEETNPTNPEELDKRIKELLNAGKNRRDSNPPK